MENALTKFLISSGCTGGSLFLDIFDIIRLIFILLRSNVDLEFLMAPKEVGDSRNYLCSYLECQWEGLRDYRTEEFMRRARPDYQRFMGRVTLQQQGWIQITGGMYTGVMKLWTNLKGCRQCTVCEPCKGTPMVVLTTELPLKLPSTTTAALGELPLIFHQFFLFCPPFYLFADMGLSLPAFQSVMLMLGLGGSGGLFWLCLLTSVNSLEMVMEWASESNPKGHFLLNLGQMPHFPGGYLLLGKHRKQQWQQSPCLWLQSLLSVVLCLFDIIVTDYNLLPKVRQIIETIYSTNHHNFSTKTMEIPQMGWLSFDRGSPLEDRKKRQRCQGQLSVILRKAQSQRVQTLSLVLNRRCMLGLFGNLKVMGWPVGGQWEKAHYRDQRVTRKKSGS